MMKSGHNSDLFARNWRQLTSESLIYLLDLLQHMATIHDDLSSHKILKLFIQSCSDLFFSYLTNRELGVLDRVITDINLRQIYFHQAGLFYLNNKVQSLAELKWIMKRNIKLVKCNLDFSFDG